MWPPACVDTDPTSCTQRLAFAVSKKTRVVLAHIRGLYRRRNELIHTALATAGDNSIPGVPSGAIIDLRSYGVGFTKREGDTWTIGLMAKRIG